MKGAKGMRTAGCSYQICTVDLFVNVWSKQNTLIAKPHGSHVLTSHCLCIVWIDFFHRVPSSQWEGVYNHTIFCVEVEEEGKGLSDGTIDGL